MSRRNAPRPRGPSLGWRTAAGLAVTGTLLALACMDGPLRWLAAGGLLASAVTFVLYWKDKRAAVRGLQRTPERTLQLIAAVGGWPGALLAQGVLGHKHRKSAFQRVFWLCVMANIASAVVLLR